MADTTFRLAGTGVNVAVGGNVDWTNPSFITGIGDASVGLIQGTQSDRLKGTNFTFSGEIPAAATIDGITVNCTGTFYNGAGSPTWIECFLNLADDTLGTENKFAELAAFDTEPITVGAGGVSDLWGETIDRADVIDVDWGFLTMVGEEGDASTTINIDNFYIRVSYTSEDVTVTGTVVGATESQIAAGGRTLILDLVGTEWLASGSAFDNSRQSIIDGIDSAQSETLGWNNEVRDTMGVGQVARTSNTKVTITLLAAEVEDYKTTANDVLTATIPAAAHTGVEILTHASFTTITAECDQTLAPDTIATQTNLTGAVTDIDEPVDSPDANWLLAA